MSDFKLDWNQLHRVFATRVTVPQQSSVVNHDLALDLAEERAAIMEYDGGMSRRVAEKLAYDQAQTASHKLNDAATAR